MADNHLCNQLSRQNPIAFHVLGYRLEDFKRIQFTAVVPSSKFVHVSVEVLVAEVVESAMIASLQQRSERLDTVCMQHDRFDDLLC